MDGGSRKLREGLDGDLGDSILEVSLHSMARAKGRGHSGGA